MCEEPTEGLRRAIERKRRECAASQFATKRRGGKIWCHGKGVDALAMIEAVATSGGRMPEPRRLDLPLLPQGQDERFYLALFMAEFGAESNETAILRDKTDTVDLAISRRLFTDHKTGGSKIAKEGRAAYLLYLAKTIMDPDEIWRHEGKYGDRALYLLARFALKAGIVNALAVFKEDGKVWTGWSAYQTFDATYFAGKRRNKTLVYMRN